MSDGIEMLVNPFRRDEDKTAQLSQRKEEAAIVIDETVAETCRIIRLWKDDIHHLICADNLEPVLPILTYSQINSALAGLTCDPAWISDITSGTVSTMVCHLIQKSYNDAIAKGAPDPFYLSPCGDIQLALCHLQAKPEKRLSVRVDGDVFALGTSSRHADHIIHGSVDGIFGLPDDCTFTVYGSIGHLDPFIISSFTHGLELRGPCDVKTTDEKTYLDMYSSNVTKNGHQIHLINSKGEILRSNGE